MTALASLLGYRIGYSASPAMHNAAFAALGIDARYELADVAPGGLADAVDELRASDRLGANVTQPHKLAVCDLVDEVAPEVDRLGAANTIVRHGTRLVAHNTDLAAIAAEIEVLGRFASAVVLGAGGASRAAQAALEDAGTTMEVVDRSRWPDLPDLLAAADIVVNATPIGTASDESPVAASLLRPDLAVLDLVYRPVATRLVRDARAVGASATSGLGVLLRQGAASFALWTVRAAPIDVMRETLERELGATVDA